MNRYIRISSIAGKLERTVARREGPPSSVPIAVDQLEYSTWRSPKLRETELSAVSIRPYQLFGISTCRAAARLPCGGLGHLAHKGGWGVNGMDGGAFTT